MAAKLKWERVRDTSEWRDTTKRFVITPGGGSRSQLALRDLRTDPERSGPPLALGTLKFCKDQAQKRATAEEEAVEVPEVDPTGEQLSSKQAETRDADDKPTGEAAEEFLPKAAAAEQQESERPADEDDEDGERVTDVGQIGSEDSVADEPATFAEREVKTPERDATKAPAKKGKR